MKGIHVRVLATILILLGLIIFAYKHFKLGLPIAPDKKVEVWNVEAKITVKVAPGATKIQFYVPENPYGYTIVDEDFIARNYGLSMEKEGANRYAIWAVRKSEGRDVLYYRVQLIKNVNNKGDRTNPAIISVDIPDYPEIEKTAIDSLLSEVRTSSADISTFTRELIKKVNTQNDSNVSILMKDVRDDLGLVKKIKYILAGARIPARPVYLLELHDGVRNSDLIPYIEVNDGKKWVAFNPTTGVKGIPENMLVWKVDDEPVIRMTGGDIKSVNFSVAKGFRQILDLSKGKIVMKSPFIDYSLLALPINTQNIYRVLITLPLGAIVVVFMRNIVGLQAFGTFMPILIALAFRDTNLLLGIVLFTIIVSLGLFLRFYLERLKLLMVPRLSAVLIIVIMLMVCISIISQKLGIHKALSVALFPMVIISMTIERMSIMWEERGAFEAIRNGVGSIIVASLGYVVMQNKALEHLMFVFPELLFVLLGIVILVGRYTGYRLMELWRFRYIIGKK